MMFISLEAVHLKAKDKEIRTTSGFIDLHGTTGQLLIQLMRLNVCQLYELFNVFCLMVSGTASRDTDTSNGLNIRMAIVDRAFRAVGFPPLVLVNDISIVSKCNEHKMSTEKVDNLLCQHPINQNGGAGQNTDKFNQ
jgi:hypothetical protein